MDNYNFENIIKQKLQDATIEPSNGIWSKISSKLALKIFVKNFLLIASLLTAVVIVSFFAFKPTFKNKTLYVPLNYTQNITNYRQPVYSFNSNNHQDLKNNHHIYNNAYQKNYSLGFDSSYTYSYISIINKNTNQKNWSINNLQILAVSNKNTNLQHTKKTTDSVKTILQPEADFKFVSPILVKTNADFENISSNATQYKWYIDNKFASTDSNFEYSFSNAGIYVVSLVATNANGIKDSTYKSLVVTEPEKFIVFPNAFSPNVNGPTGGYYSETIKDNSVFHPYIVSKQIRSYTLSILDRNGNQIYKSNDVNIGWDGYFNNKLVPVGVYVYNAQGTFTDNVTFREFGSVTVLY